MSARSLRIRDPRTVARDIPGVLDTIFPQLNSGMVASLNKDAVSFPGLNPIPDRALKGSKLARATLFELAVARTELFLAGQVDADWDACLTIAVDRQRRHYDAVLPAKLGETDRFLADWAANNLHAMLDRIHTDNPDYDISVGPMIPGFGWIASGKADFSLGPLLVEVKHTNTNFLAADFRQVMMYWILSYAASVEKDGQEYSECIFLNPRRNSALAFRFSKLVRLASSGLSKLELLQLFESLVGDHALRMEGVL